MNSLTGKIDISDYDWDHGLKVWQSFKCNTLGDYMHLYLKSDVLLLADVFEKFRNLFLEVYGLDPCQYYSAPNISWDAMLKKTQIKLELLSDIDMLLFCEKGIRQD